jgi:photosystem II stability/assembly factor-like uncharacterized protein
MRVRAVSFLAFALLLMSAVSSAGVGVWTTNGPPGGSYTSGGVIADSQTPGAIYAGSPYGIFKSTDNGATWLPSGLTFQSANPLATAPPATVYAAAGAPTGIYRSLDGGATWSLMSQEMCLALCNFVVDPFSSNTVFRSVGLSPTGGHELLRSTDGGMSWAEADAGLGLDHAEVTALIADPSTAGTLYAATEPIQFVTGTTPTLFKTVDSGATWVPLARGLGFPLTLAVDPTTSSTLYAGRAPNLNPFAPSGGIFKSIDGGRAFLPASNGLTNPNILSICIDPAHPNRVYVSTGYGGVFASTDGGASWNPMNTGLTNEHVVSLAIDSTGTHLHAATGSGVFDYEINSNCSTATTLCLNNSRFTVTADFQSTPEGPSTPATAVPLTADTGYFWFFDPTNVEIITKVLNGCSTNGHYWFFAAGLTNLGVQITVTDMLQGTQKTYSNPVGTAFPPIQDTSAFATCP